MKYDQEVYEALAENERNKPVAWMVDGVLFTSLGAALNISFDIEQPCIPLYTHPVKEQELLDEIAQLKHINRNWQISENILLLELEKLQMRELTDEEIADCLIEWAKVEHADEYSDPTAEELAPIIRMIKAILRKAQE